MSDQVKSQMNMDTILKLKDETKARIEKCNMSNWELSKKINNFKFLKDTGKKIKYLFHISDIHITNDVERQPEYLQVFKNLYKELENHREKHEEGIIVMTGDLIHERGKYEGDTLEIVYGFLEGLLNYMDIITIYGNHCGFCPRNANKADGRTNIEKVTDGVETVYKRTKHEKNKLYYLKLTGIYEYENIYFSVNSIWDNGRVAPIWWENKNKKVVGLFHGMVCGSVLQNGMISDKYDAKLEDFKVEYLLLGDIHKYQMISKFAGYPSSLIQQNHKEDFQHGMIIWNIKDGETKFVNIKNDYGFVTYEINRGKIVNYTSEELKILPKIQRVRVFYKNTTTTECNEILKSLGYIFEKVSWHNKDDYKSRVITIDTGENENEELDLDQIIDNITDINIQRKLISDYVHKRKIPRELIEKLFIMNGEINRKIHYVYEARNKNWRIITLEFSNLFCFGENNVINFEKFGKNEWIKINGANAFGKSSILEIILWVLYEKYSKFDKTSGVANIHKDYFRASLVIEINGKRYKIERWSTEVTYTEGICRVKTECNFYEFVDADFRKIEVVDRVISNLKQDKRNEEKSNEELLRQVKKGIFKKEINKVIIEKIGTMENLLMSNVVLQNSMFNPNHNFLSLSQSKKIDKLTELSRLQIYEELFKVANEEYRTKKKELIFYSNIDQIHEEGLYSEKIALSIKDKKEAQGRKEYYENEIKKLNIENDKIKIVKKDEELEKISESVLTKEINQLEKEIKEIKNKIITNKINETEDELSGKKVVKTKELLEQTNELGILNGKKSTSKTKDELDELEKSGDLVSKSYKIKNEEVEKLTQELECLTGGVCYDLEKAYNDYEEKKRVYEKIVTRFNNEKDKFKKSAELIKRYEGYIPNPLCEICQTNPFTVEKNKTLEEHTEIEKSVSVMGNELESLKTYLFDNKLIVKRYEDNEKLKKDIKKLGIERSNKIKDIEMVKIEKASIDKLIDEYKKNVICAEESDKIKRVTENIELIQIELSEINLKLSKLSSCKSLENKLTKIVNDCESKKLLLERKKVYAKDQKDNKENESNLIKNKKMIDEIQKSLDKVNSEIGKIKGIIEGINEKLHEQTQNKVLIIEKEREIEVLSIYLEMVNRKGIPYRLLTYIVDQIKIKAMTFLRSISKLRIDMRLERSKESNTPPEDENKASKKPRKGRPKKEVNKRNNVHEIKNADHNLFIYRIDNGKPLIVNNNSGYEGFMIDLAIKLAITQCTNIGTNGFLFLDEATSPLDKDNLNKCGDIFDYLKQIYEQVYVISHQDKISERFESKNAITIDKKKSGSYVKN